MLKPDERAHLMNLLRPPGGCRLDCAVGTTFSLDLLSALTIPLSFAYFDWEKPDGTLEKDPLAWLEALRRYGDHFTIFCQSGQIRLPENYQPLITFLEPCIYDVLPRDPQGVFHPKFWALRFVSPDKSVSYRVLCLSRNLTFDRCWDTALVLDGELLDRQNAIATNHQLADFVEALPPLAVKPVSRERRETIANMVYELRRVRFSWPDGFDPAKCCFWTSGLDGKSPSPFGLPGRKALIVSPFLSDGLIKGFTDEGVETHIVSRPESFDVLPPQTLKDCKSLHVLAPEAIDESDENDSPPGSEETLDGLHAKMFVIDRGWHSSVFTGSFNATNHAFQHNVEFMVELVGKRSAFGVDKFLTPAKGETTFADLLQPYDIRDRVAQIDADAKQLDKLIHDAKRALVEAGPKLEVTPAGAPDLFDLTLGWQKLLILPAGSLELRAWPVTQNRGTARPLAKSVTFADLSYMGLTTFVVFLVSAQAGRAKGETTFALNLPITGAPDDRQERVLRSLIDNRDHLLRYILFLLASGNESSASDRDLRSLLTSAGDAKVKASTPFLLETMLRALHREPAQLERVASLLDSLGKAPGSSELLSEDFQELWAPIWQAAQRTG
ncbi:MAG: phospholipase D family protein [Alphaproteobacteria bacterium]|nr:phospholipase D family protein [Alphaproteobacteria bacterium]